MSAAFAKNPNAVKTEGPIVAAGGDNTIELPIAAEQDFEGQAQYARPVILRGLLRGLKIQVIVMAICTLIVCLMVAREQVAGNRVWASTPEGTTYELLIHDDEQAAAAFESRHQTNTAAAAQQAH